VQPFLICSISYSMDTSATDDDSMPRFEKTILFAIQAILENTCLAVNLDYAHLYDDEYGRHFGSGDELNSIIQT
jgi:hypothetical protein